MTSSSRHLTSTAEAVLRQLEDDARAVADRARALRASRLGPQQIVRIRRRLGLAMQSLGEGLVKDVDAIEGTVRRRQRAELTAADVQESRTREMG